MTEPGERDLDRLLATLAPVLAPVEYAFAAHDGGVLPDGTFALIREAEGDGIVVERDGGGWARITLTVHSSLEAVGLSAELTRRLTARGIAANVIAGLRHDHVFVPWDRRAEALAAIAAID